MDPLTGLGLVCNAVSLIDIGLKLAKGCREIHVNGRTRDDADIAEIAKTIAVATDTTQHSDPEEKHLSTIAQKTSQTATELLSILQRLEAKRNSRFATISIFLSSIWQRQKIDAAVHRLSEYRKALNTARIAQLCANVSDNVFVSRGLNKTLDSLIENHENTFVEMAENFQALARRISMLQEVVERQAETILLRVDQKSQSLEDVFLEQIKKSSNLASSDGNETRKLLANFEANRTDIKLRSDFLSSLSFGEMYKRQEEITPAHRETFRWVLDRDKSSYLGNASLVNWLERGDGIFWMEGKPGSGKSTLMNFVHHESATQQYLRAWVNNAAISMPSFYFWKAGTKSQKSFVSALRVFAHRIFSDAPHLCVMFMTKIQSELGDTSSRQASERSLSAWTQDRLYSLIKFALECRRGEAGFCFIIDGLDECEGLDAITAGTCASGVRKTTSAQLLEFELNLYQTPVTLHRVAHSFISLSLKIRRKAAQMACLRLCEDQLADFIQIGLRDMLDFIIELKAMSHVKFCVSSRKGNVFSDHLPAQNKIYLHELTQDDINSYVQAEFDRTVKHNTSSRLTQQEISTLASDIVSKADGVFFWAYLVVRDVCKGIHDCSTVLELRTWINNLPPDLEKLFVQLLDRIPKAYHQNTAQYIQILLAAHETPLYLLDFILASESSSEITKDDPASQFLHAYDSEDQESSVRQWLEHKKSRVDARCDNFISFARSFRYGSGFSETTQKIALTPAITKTGDDLQKKAYLQFDTVNFLHRTVRDFFSHSPDGIKFLKHNTHHLFMPEISLMRACMRWVWIATATKMRQNTLDSDFVIHVFKYALLIQDSDLTRLAEVVDELDYCMQKVANIISTGHSSQYGSHWGRFIEYFPWWFMDLHRPHCKEQRPHILHNDTNAVLTAFGLGDYVLTKIVRSSPPVSSEYLNSLLFATNFGAEILRDDVRPGKTHARVVEGSLSFASQLLELGADPNAHHPCMYDWDSPWQCLLSILWNMCPNFFKNFGETSLSEPEALRKGIAIVKAVFETLESYLTSGATLDQRISNTSTRLASPGFGFEAEDDVSAVISLLLGKLEEFSYEHLKLEWDPFWSDCVRFDLRSFLRDHVGVHNILANLSPINSTEYPKAWEPMSYKVSEVYRPKWPYTHRSEARGEHKGSATHEKLTKFTFQSHVRNHCIKLNAEQSTRLTKAMKICEITLGIDKRHVHWEYKQIMYDHEIEDNYWARSRIKVSSLFDPPVVPQHHSWPLKNGEDLRNRNWLLAEGDVGWEPDGEGALEAFNDRHHQMSAILTP